MLLWQWLWLPFGLTYLPLIQNEFSLDSFVYDLPCLISVSHTLYRRRRRRHLVCNFVNSTYIVAPSESPVVLCKWMGEKIVRTVSVFAGLPTNPFSSYLVHHHHHCHRHKQPNTCTRAHPDRCMQTKSETTFLYLISFALVVHYCFILWCTLYVYAFI